MKLLFSKQWPFFAIIFVVLLYFWKVFLLGQAPIPGDFIVGTYFPWLDYKWGYSVGVPVKNPVTSDVVSIVYPLRSYAVDILKQGRLPLWNPFMFTGTPLLADFQVGVFSPTIIFYFLLPKIWAWTAQIMLQPLLAAAFCYLLLRNFGLGKSESFFGGVFYSFAAFNVIWMEWNANTLVAAFIPLLILLLDKYINSNKLYWGVLLSVTLCLQIFSGYPQVVIFSIIALLIFVIFRIRKISKAKFVYILLFIFAGILLSSIITLPGMELILNSQRKFETLASDLIYLPWQNLITFLAPDYFGNHAAGNYFGVGNYTINSGYSGLIVLQLALLGVINYWKRIEVKYFVCLIFLTLMFALPNPFSKFIYESHILGISASSNTRILVLSNLSIAMLSGFGLFGLYKKERIANFKVFIIPLVIILIVLGITLLGGPHRNISLRNLILPIGLGFTSTTLLLFRNNHYKNKILRILLISTLCIIATLELFRYGWKYTPFSLPKLVFPETPALTYFKNDNDIYRVSPGDVIPMNMWVPYNIESVSGYDAVYPIWWAQLFNVIGGQDPTKPNFSYYAPFDKYNSPWFELLNNKYLYVFNPNNTLDGKSSQTLINQINDLTKFTKVFQDKSVAIFKNNSAYPRAFFVSDWEVDSDKETLTTLIDPNFPLNTKIVISKDVGLKKSEEVSSKVTFNYYSPGKSILNVSNNKDGFLFVSDSWYPGWIAKVDGINIPIYRADYAFRAVPLSIGVHRVEFIYDPESLKIGEMVSIVTLIFLIGILILEKRIYENKNSFTVSVVMPNLNGEKLLEKNLPKLIAAKNYSPNGIIEIIIVDDGSWDGSINLLKKKFPEVRLFRHTTNRGFSAAVNTGARAAKGDLILLINTDVIPNKDFLVKILPNFIDRSVFAVSLHEKGFGSAKGTFVNGYIQLAMGEEGNKNHPSFYVSGGSGVFRRTVWVDLGGMDEKLLSPFYWEDIDLCYRASKRGYKLLWEPGGLVEHHHESTISKFPKDYVARIRERNQILMLWKNVTSPNLTRKHIAGLISRLIKHPGYIRIILMAMPRFGIAMQKRAKERKESKVSDEAIFARYD